MRFHSAEMNRNAPRTIALPDGIPLILGWVTGEVRVLDLCRRRFRLSYPPKFGH